MSLVVSNQYIIEKDMVLWNLIITIERIIVLNNRHNDLDTDFHPVKASGIQFYSAQLRFFQTLKCECHYVNHNFEHNENAISTNFFFLRRSRFKLLLNMIQFSIIKETFCFHVRILFEIVTFLIDISIQERIYMFMFTNKLISLKNFKFNCYFCNLKLYFFLCILEAVCTVWQFVLHKLYFVLNISRCDGKSTGTVRSFSKIDKLDFGV